MGWAPRGVGYVLGCMQTSAGCQGQAGISACGGQVGSSKHCCRRASQACLVRIRGRSHTSCSHLLAPPHLDVEGD